MDNAYDFHGICKEYLKEEKHYQALIDNTNFVRPEDMHLYEPYFEAAKLANAHHFITKLPEGYDTVISGDGGTLSQGIFWNY